MINVASRSTSRMREPERRGSPGSDGADRGAGESYAEAAKASGPCSAASGSIHMTCQPWPSRS